MRILILGGTVFLGRALTDAALARGHSVTHMNRGRSAGTDARVETLVVDRTAIPFAADLPRDRTWDAVIDTCGYLPQVVRRSAEGLRDRVGLYVFVSSISVHRAFDAPGFTEDAPLQSPPHPLPDAMTLELYGALKAGCEHVVREAHGDNALVVRPGLLVGPHDPTDRFTWWPHRAARGGVFAAPGRSGRPVQLIDVRDLASWMISMTEQRVTGTFQATGPAGTLTMGELIDACVAAAGGEARPEWIDEAFLLEQGVQPWRDMPLWLPETDATNAGFMAADCTRAIARGLTFRPIRDTVEATLAWSSSRDPRHAWKAGLGPETEAGLLEAWARWRTALA